MTEPDRGARVVWALRRAFHAVEADKVRRLRTVGVPVAHYQLLINLASTPGITSAELARRLSLTPQNIASLVAKLESQGLVSRAPHELHGHVRELRLTDDGMAAFELADAHITALDDDLVAELGDEDAEVLRSLLERLAAFPEPGPTPRTDGSSE